MNKIPVPIEITDMSTKWGLVTVLNPDQTINRQYRITAQEAEAVHRGNNVLPPNCTHEEWSSGLVIVASRPCNPGQAVINPDGTLVMNLGIKEINSRVLVSLATLTSDEWEQMDSEKKVKIVAQKAPELLIKLSNIGIV